MKFLWIIGFISVCIWLIILGSPLRYFWDLPSLILVLASTIFLPLSKFGHREVLKFTDEIIISFIHGSIVGACMGIGIGTIQVLLNLTESSAFGPASAVLVTPAFYSLFITSILYFSKKSIQVKDISIPLIGLTVLIMIPLAGLVAANTK